MNDVQFNPEDTSFNAPTYRDTTKKSKMIELVMKTGLVKDETQANYVLAALAALFFLVMVVTISKMNTTAKITAQPMQKEQIPENIVQQLTPEDIAQIPDPFYREDIPMSVINKLPSDVVKKIPSRSK